MTDKFFVYGTLKEGGHFARQFNELRTSSKVATLKGFDLFKIGGGHSSWFPGIVPGKGKVIGELHEYRKDKLDQVRKHMDMIEGYSEDNEENSLYIRTTAEVELEDGTVEEVNIYVFNRTVQKDYPKVESGIWAI